jgi:hypothetical protein
MTHDRKAGKWLQPEPTEDQHDQPQAQGRGADAPGDGQATPPATSGVG